ncbi:MAG TPA: pyridoxal phosphate-dependent aminotransferase [Candidatus Sulfotelmatobacter sp.]|jgi:histidinol-phosphate aminotransferase|nr:pyridoxal phosphate-dependent aminotransferase [Candidatus Sulfotelmatobacter sp.]
MSSEKVSPFSRRSFLQLSAAAASFQIFTEPMLAAAVRRRAPFSKDAVMIDSNENPLGPSQSAREAISAIIPLGGRYLDNLTDDLVHTLAQQEGLNPDYVHVFPGSSPPLRFTVVAFTSPQKSYVTADPGYEAGMMAASVTGARVVKIPLTKTYAHDVKAMIAAAPDAGLFYVCSPNNPTGTLTPHSDIEYLVENKPKGSIVMVDEAYLHFCDAPSSLDFVKAGKDVVVLRTFSKTYGMAGLRCGFAIARPDLLEKIMDRAGWNFMPVTAVAAAAASLKDASLVPERKRINASVRQETFQWLDSNDYTYIPSESNCFLLDTKRLGKEVIDAMAAQNVFIGRIWPIMPTCVRITVGTHDEMEKFQAALQKVMRGTTAFAVPELAPLRNRRKLPS